MKIETYEIEPSSEIQDLADDSVARELCESLGLTGQLSLSNNESQTVFPYRHMTAQEKIVYDYHCPYHTKLTDYKSDKIPLRVLQVASHAQSCGVLHHIEVWHPKDAKLDPVLVGCTGAYGGDLYLLARWGEVWQDYKTLLAQAIAGLKSNRSNKIKKAQRDLATHLANVSEDVELWLAGGSEPQSYISI